jgi:ribosomal protein S18 acetylase RimI-like enzyme
VDHELTRIEAFCRWVEDETSTKTTTWRFGRALFHEDFPDFYDHNFLRVVGDETDGERLAPGFADLGWRTERLLYQVRRREPDGPAPVAVREVSIDEAMPFREETWRRPYGAAAVPLAGFGRVLAERIGARFFVAEVDGAMAAGCELYQHDGVAQIETVDTLEEYRGRGLARSVVLGATEAALASGADLILIVADDDDWPKQLYAKLGFDPVGRFWQFTLPPASAT